MSKPLILITNDDGIFAPGLKALVEAVKPFGTPVVVAPDSPQSGKGHAITLNDPLRVNKVDVFEGIEAYETSGTPVDCVKLARHVILDGREIDLCVSGINHGSNEAINIIYSGTMSAAMEASLEGINSIGFSLLDYSFEADFSGAQMVVSKILKHVLENGFGKAKLLNVNIPKLPAKEIQGIKICRQANAMWEEKFMEGTDPRGGKYYWLTGEFKNKDHGTDTDSWALVNGFASVVPSHHDLTDYPAMEGLAKLEDGFSNG